MENVINFATPNKNKVIMEKTYVWLNAYDRNTRLVSSRPFSNLVDAQAEKERVETLIQKFKLPHRLEIEDKGNLELYVQSEWCAISANYEGYYRNDYQIRHYIYQTFGLDIQKWEEFAEKYYANPKEYEVPILMTAILIDNGF